MFEEKIKEIKATIASLNQAIATKTAESNLDGYFGSYFFVSATIRY